MPLRIRILLWVSTLFLATIFFIFVISNYEINSSLTKEKASLISQIKKVDEANDKNILTFLGININNDAQKMYDVFESLRTSTQWRKKFLPNAYNIRTKSWGSSAAVLATYPWLDLINVEVNGKPTAYIRQAAPFLRKYLKVSINENITIFVTKKDDGLLTAHIGVPFWTNDAIGKYVDNKDYPDFFAIKGPNQWLLYNADELLSIDTESLSIKDDELYKHLFDEAVTIHSEKEYYFLLNSVKTMIDVTKNALKKNSQLINILRNQKSHQPYLERKIAKIKSNIDYQRKYCEGPLCNFVTLYNDPPWATRRNFEHKAEQKKLIWELCMLTRTGMWDFSPFEKGAPKGIVTDLEPATSNQPDFFKYVSEGFYREDIFLNKTINVKRRCKLSVGDKEYDQKVIFKGISGGKALSCRNCCLNILYDEDLKEPYLTNTNYITYQKPPMTKENVAAITFGIALDPILINLALVSPNDVAFIFNNKDIRLYTTSGQIVNITNDHSDENRERLITEQQGSLIDKHGKKIFFTHLTKLTDNNDHIVLIEKEESRTAIIDRINKHIKSLSHRIIINSSILIICSLITIMFILNKVIRAITKPINSLARIAGDVTSRKLESIEIDENQAKRKDEIGTLYTSFADMLTAMKEGNKVRGLLDKVVSKQVAAKIVKEGIKLGGEKRNLTVMFCDIRNFTSITERMDPVDVLVMLNECLTLLSGIIDDFEGVIDKYEGDKIMTLFGAPLDSPNHSLQAVLCSIEMQKALVIWNDHREKNGFCKLEVGIGVHSGIAVAGNVGAENHLSYTVLGHFVNVSARLCDAAKGGEILITKETLNASEEHIKAQQNPAQHFKGITDPIITYSVTGKKK
jgi:class 3 adenylate cyclase